MAEYIERDAVVNAIEHSDFDISDCDGYEVIFGMSIGKIHEIINSIPASDVALVVHGRWVPTEYPFMNEGEDCSQCGYRTIYGNEFNYCPNCGAKMDLEDMNK